MSDIVGSLVVKLAADIAEFSNSMDKATAVAKKSMSDISSAVNTAKHALELLGVGISANAFAEMVKGTIEAEAAMGRMAQQTGVNVQTLSGLAYSADLSGVGLEQLGVSLDKLAKNMQATANGTGHAQAGIDALGISAKGGAAKAFKDLGINVLDGNKHLKDAGVIMLEVADKFHNMADGATKTADAQLILNRSGAQMIAWLNQGSAAIKEQVEDARKLGKVITDDMVKAAKDAEENFKQLKAASDGLKIHLTNELLPSITKITTAMAEAAKESGLLKSLWVGLGGLGAAAFTDDLKTTEEKLQKANDKLQRMQTLYSHLAKGSITPDNQRALEFQKQLVAQLKETLLTEQMLAALDKLEPNKAKPKPTINNVPSDKGGPAFLESLQRQIEKIGQGEYAMLRFEAAQKKVAKAAEPLIQKLQATAEAHARLIAEQEGQAKATENLIELMNKNEFFDPGKIDDYIHQQTLATDAIAFQTSIIGKTAEQQRELTEARRIDLEVIALSKDMNAENTAELKKQADVIKNQMTKAMKDNLAVSRTWQTGMTDAINTYVDAATNAAAQTANLFSNAFKGMEDALVQFAQTGKLNFKQFADSVIADIIRIQIQRNITGPLASALGNSGGSWIGSLMSSLFGSAKGNVFGPTGVQAFAAGGVVSSPTIFPFAGGAGLMGEAGPEAILPLQRGPNGALGVMATQGKSSANQVVVQIIESPGNGGKTSQTQNGNTTFLKVFVEQVKGAIASDIARGSGAIPAALGNTYGLSRAPGAY